MNVLLDTHVLVWAATAPELLTSEAREAIEDPENDVRISAVSAWELGIKQSLGKIELARPVEKWLPEVMRRSGFGPLAVTLKDAARVRALPGHHRDPFDRLLIAQAGARGLTVVTRDRAFAKYAVELIEA
jgi:PIN domain nuclease of toxin-antitoxin system